MIIHRKFYIFINSCYSRKKPLINSIDTKIKPHHNLGLWYDRRKSIQKVLVILNSNLENHMNIKQNK